MRPLPPAGEGWDEGGAWNCDEAPTKPEGCGTPRPMPSAHCGRTCEAGDSADRNFEGSMRYPASSSISCVSSADSSSNSMAVSTSSKRTTTLHAQRFSRKAAFACCASGTTKCWKTLKGSSQRFISRLRRHPHPNPSPASGRGAKAAGAPRAGRSSGRRAARPASTDGSDASTGCGFSPLPLAGEVAPKARVRVAVGLPVPRAASPRALNHSPRRAPRPERRNNPPRAAASAPAIRSPHQIVVRCSGACHILSPCLMSNAW